MGRVKVDTKSAVKAQLPALNRKVLLMIPTEDGRKGKDFKVQGEFVAEYQKHLSFKHEKTGRRESFMKQDLVFEYIKYEYIN